MIAGYPLDIARTAFILGGTGQIGRAAASRLIQAGWSVTVAGRNEADVPEGAVFRRVDRTVDGELETAVGEGADVLVDVIPLTPADASQTLALGDRVGSIVAISTAAVYEDEEGRSLDTQEVAFPRLPVPVTESQRTIEPGDATYATRKAAMERALLDSGVAATIIRPCAVHGIGPRPPRELHFVRRVLDGRRAVVLAYLGESRFHTTSVENLAELIRLAGERPGRRILNCGDPAPPKAVEIARAIAAALEHEWAEVLLPGPPVGGVGDSPWTGPSSFVLEMRTAEIELGYRPVTTYERAVETTCRWLAESRPEPPPHMAGGFDYEAEDAFLATLPGSSL